MGKLIRIIIFSIGLTVAALTGWSAPKISVLTCSPGQALYTGFGHTAIRLQDTLEGKPLDLVFNYGTFRFTEEFYLQFAQGRLDYFLSVNPFYEFQEMYLYEGRGIQEQALLMSRADLEKLSELLIENAQPANATFRYHFFFDNCSVRVWEIIKKASSVPIEIPKLPSHGTFRQAIDHYLTPFPWGDWGIDMALGAPCDKTMQDKDLAFLPDSLLYLLSKVKYNGQPLCGPAQELIPVDDSVLAMEFNDTSSDSILGKVGNEVFYWGRELMHRVPPVLFFGFFTVLVGLSGFWVARKGKLRTWLESAFALFFAILGSFIVFLWFFTDHDTTHQNWNLLWAHPFWFYLLSCTPRRCGTWMRKICMVQLVISVLTLILFFFLPQTFHGTVVWMLLVQIYMMLKSVKPFWFTKTLNEKKDA
jgi:hypothetical protein